MSEASEPLNGRKAGVTLLQQAAELDTCPAAGALMGGENRTPKLKAAPENLNSGPVSAGALHSDLYFTSESLTPKQ